MERNFKKLTAVIVTLALILTVLPFALAGLVTAETTYAVGDIIEFGSYPQSKVTDETTLTALNAALTDEDWVSYGYYSGTGEKGTMTAGDYMKYADKVLDGVKYRAVTFSAARPSITYEATNSANYQDGAGYVVDTTYWFKYEPLEWRVLDPATGYILCESVIDSQPYSETVYEIDKDNSGTFTNTEFFNDAAGENYANDYATSTIRAWLNGSFFDTAFTAREKATIKFTELDNSGQYGDTYDSEATTDKVFFPSYTDMCNTAYGFSSSNSGDVARKGFGTDYAQSQGLSVYRNAAFANWFNTSIWWLRSAHTSSASSGNISNSGGAYCGTGSFYTYAGVRPAVTLNLNPVAVSGVALNAENVTIAADGTYQLVSEITPADAVYRDVTWTTSDSTIATVDAQGLVTAVSAGVCAITVNTADGGFMDSCIVKVSPYKMGDIIEFGSYPQSNVTDEAVLTALNATLTYEDWISYGYYSGTGTKGSMTAGDYMKYADKVLDGVKYRAVTFSAARPSITYEATNSANYQDGAGYVVDTTYWFKYEPLEWRVLDPATGYILCESVIDSQPYSETVYEIDKDNSGTFTNTEFFNDAAAENYANDYATSTIRAWLNGSFADTAFTAGELLYLNATLLDNSAQYGDTYSSEATTDKVFLPSYTDMCNTAYGFSSSNSGDVARKGFGTDYAQSQGLSVYRNAAFANWFNTSIWWLRSAHTSSASSGNISNSGGAYCGTGSFYTYAGVRPAVTLNLDAISVTGVALSDESLTLAAGGNYQLSATVTPDDASFPLLTWSSSDEAVATVGDTGIITAVSCGSCTITVTTVDGAYTAECAVIIPHNYLSEWTIDIEATCTAVGSKSHHCTVCGEKADITEIEMTAHEYGEWETVTPATCTAAGLSKRVCINCPAEETEVIAIRPHSYSSEWTLDLEPTRTSAGVKSHHCTVCDAQSDITTIPALTSDVGVWVTRQDPTCNSSGIQVRIVDFFGTEEIRNLPALEHVDADGDYLCDDCHCKMDNYNVVLYVLEMLKRFFEMIFGVFGV